MTKKYFYYFVLLFVLFLLQTSSLKVFMEVSYLVPFLVLLFVVNLAISGSLKETLWFGFIAGFLFELFSTSFFGGYTMAMLLSGLLVYFVTRQITSQEESLPEVLFLISLSTLFFSAILYLYSATASGLGLTVYQSLENFLSGKIVFSTLINFLFFYPTRFFVKYAKSISSEE